MIKAAESYLNDKPVTVTASHSPRSAGGLHDFFSEGDYWWPDPKNPDGPYIQRDGMTNPDNFVEHRKAADAFERRSSRAGRGVEDHARRIAMQIAPRCTCAPGSSTMRRA